MLLVGLTSGFFGATVGGGGLISLPAFIFIGLNPKVAIGTVLAGDLAAFAPAIYRYWRAKKISKDNLLQLTIIALLGSILGAQLLVSLPANIIKNYMAVLILALLVFVLWNRSLGISTIEVSDTRKKFGYFLFFLVSANTAIAPAGGATLSLFVVVSFLGLEMIAGYATICIPIFIRMFAISIFCFYQGLINIPIAAIFGIGSLLGGFWGAGMAISKGNSFLRILYI